MTREFQVYSGAAPQSAQVSGKQVPLFAGVPQEGAAVDAAIGEVQELGVRLARLHDLGVQQRVTQERERIRTEMDVEMQQAAEAAWGSSESLFRADGSVNSDRYDAIVAKYWGECDGIQTGEFALRENAVRYEGEKEMERNGLALRMLKFAAARSLENTRKAFSDNLKLAVGREDWAAARGLVEDARGSLLNDTEAEIELLKLKRGQLRAGSRAAGYGRAASVNVGGTDYAGLSAALAMEEARRGPRFRGEGASGSSAANLRQDGTPKLGEVSTSQGLAEVSQEMAGDAPVQDMSKALTLMPWDEFCEVSDAFAEGNRVLTLPQRDGGVSVSAAPHAPECVQRAAAHGNAHGGVDAEQARMMVARISLDAVANHSEVTDAQVLNMFDDAGIYEAMGEGDAAVGKERCRAIVSEMIDRGRGDTKKLSTGAIEPMVEAHLGSREFEEGREWGKVRAADPRRAKDGAGWEAWDKSDLDEGERKRWFALYDVYRKYRKEFKPDAAGELDKDEFEENAQAFHEWYMSKKYNDLKKADKEAARDWYTMRIASDLRQKVYAGADEGASYAGYGHDVQVARDVLRTLPPDNLGADELVAASLEVQKKDAERSKAFRRAAASDYVKLRDLKHSEASNKKAERAAEDQAKRDAEKEAARRLFVARSTPREGAWKWDGRNALDGEQPGCLIPEHEYKRLVEELGFDGSQTVYVQVNGARIMVNGRSESGKIELNAPAVAKVQKKPNSKRGERWKTDGNLGFSYYFRSVEAK